MNNPEIIIQKLEPKHGDILFIKVPEVPYNHYKAMTDSWHKFFQEYEEKHDIAVYPILMVGDTSIQIMRPEKELNPKLRERLEAFLKTTSPVSSST